MLLEVSLGSKKAYIFAKSSLWDGRQPMPRQPKKGTAYQADILIKAHYLAGHFGSCGHPVKSL